MHEKRPPPQLLHTISFRASTIRSWVCPSTERIYGIIIIIIISEYILQVLRQSLCGTRLPVTMARGD